MRGANRLPASLPKTLFIWMRVESTRLGHGATFAPGVDTAFAKAAKGCWQTVTMLGAISTEGWTATMRVADPPDSEVFWPASTKCSDRHSASDRWC